MNQPIAPRFENRHALVTGGGSGIGQTIALRLASEGALFNILELSTAAGK